MRSAQMRSRSPSSALTGLFVLVLAGLLALPFASAQAQSDEPADTTEGFQYELTGRFSGSQAAYRNWQEGGLNTLSFGATLDGVAEEDDGRWQQRHDARLAFGLLTTEADEEGEPIRKTDDLIRAESNFRYAGSGFFRRFKPTLSARVRTQFARGFDYTENPFSEEPLASREPPVQTSAFLAPGTFVETLGLTYAPKDWYTVSLSAASKQTVVREEDLRVLYDVDPDRLARVEAGAEIAATVDRQLAENVRYQSSATVFYAVGQIEEPPDALWENYITMRINSWLTTNLEFVALFDDNTSDAIQLKEVLSVGVTVDFI
jgi:hypothetical protein